MKRFWIPVLVALLVLPTVSCKRKGEVRPSAAELTLVALGDSLTEGYGVSLEASYPVQLERALRDRGWHITLVNEGVSGETSRETLLRVEDVIADHQPHLVLLETGANDGLRRMSIPDMEENLRAILTRFEEEGIPVLLLGMELNLRLGPKYAADFKDAYHRVAEETNTPFYPFFLKDVALRAKLNLADLIHPNQEGYAVIVKNLLPEVERVLGQHY